MYSRRTRRDFFFQSSAGLGSVALSAMLSNEQARAGVLSPKPPHHPPRAKACIFLLMGGGPSHIDTFDPKPKLNQLHMTEFVRQQNKFASAMESGKRYFLQNPFKLPQVGERGLVT